MWIGHAVSALTAKPFAPSVPLSVLALAAALPDALSFVFSLLGFESFDIDEDLVKRGCYPYVADYPYSHSLVGMAASGVALAVGYLFLSGRKVTLKDEAVLLAVTLGHFFIQPPSHRPNVDLSPALGNTITPGNMGASLYDHPLALFITECLLLLGAIGVYTTFSPLATRVGYKREGYMARLWAVVAYFAAQEAHFMFSPALPPETRWIHAPLFLFKVAVNSWLLGKLETS
ncbi:hypothetical protein BU15DRAFT_40581 [Melanogaster broomeanus]|nr:hypothetical protein BU15DRAFT_40581 [Melanogaster broomeanus]